MEGSKNAQLWAKAVRGEGAVATLREIAYFVDMQNFNGGGLQKFALLYSPLAADARSKLATDALNYLANSNEPFLLHRQAAKKNAQSLNPSILDDSSRDLFCLSYLVALKLNADHARQFRLTTINRRSAILFGEAYYSDRDPRPTRVALNP